MSLRPTTNIKAISFENVSLGIGWTTLTHGFRKRAKVVLGKDTTGNFNIQWEDLAATPEYAIRVYSSEVVTVSIHVMTW